MNSVQAKVSDYCWSRFASPNSGDEALSSWQWLAPEVLDTSHATYDERSDVYSFAMICWEISTDFTYRPFEQHLSARPETVVRGEIVSNDLRPPILPSTPVQYADLFRCCWATNPNNRPSFDKICEDLTSMLKTNETRSLMRERSVSTTKNKT